MFLGQIVAISLAINFFFLATIIGEHIIVESTPRSKDLTENGNGLSGSAAVTSPQHTVGVIRSASIVLSLATVYVTPSTIGTKWFLPTLLIPHLLLFVPLLLHGDGKLAADDAGNVDLWVIGVFGVGLFMNATIDALRESEHGVGVFMVELWSHPAVSSVGLDVVFCWLSISIWVLLLPAREKSWAQGLRSDVKNI